MSLIAVVGRFTLDASCKVVGIPCERDMPNVKGQGRQKGGCLHA